MTNERQLTSSWPNMYQLAWQPRILNSTSRSCFCYKIMLSAMRRLDQPANQPDSVCVIMLLMLVVVLAAKSHYNKLALGSNTIYSQITDII